LAILLSGNIFAIIEDGFTFPQAAMNTIDTAAMRAHASTAICTSKTWLAYTRACIADTMVSAIVGARTLLALQATVALVTNTSATIVNTMAIAEKMITAVTSIPSIAFTLALDSHTIDTTIDVTTVHAAVPLITFARPGLCIALAISLVHEAIMETWCVSAGLALPLFITFADA